MDLRDAADKVDHSQQVHEYACHEGNRDAQHPQRGARREKQANTASRPKQKEGHGRAVDHPFVRPRASGPSGTADAEARREPQLLRQRHGDDRDGAPGRLGLPARLGRLRAPHAEADGGEGRRHGHFAFRASSPEALQNRVGIIERPGSARDGPTATSVTGRRTRSRRPTATTWRSTGRPSGTRRRRS